MRSGIQTKNQDITMKRKLHIQRFLQNLLLVVFVSYASSEIVAQEKKATNLKDFKVVVEKTDNVIKMQSIEGSAWIYLTFRINNNSPQAIDEYGMTELNTISLEKDSNLADFLFTITKTESGFMLKGIEGTAWTDLRFSLTGNRKQATNQFGMTKLN